MKDAIHFENSTLRERIVEHVFVGEALKTLWAYKIVDVEILRSECDAYGYDLVLSRGRVTRHIQFKTGTSSKPNRVSVSKLLSKKPSGCVIWIKISEKLDMGPFFWFGNNPNEPLPDIESYDKPKRATHNSKGVRPERVGHRLIPNKEFIALESMEAVLTKLLGELTRTPQEDIEATSESA